MKSYYPHWEYFKKVCRHKWHVGRACFRYGLYWRGIVHDLSKFSRAEFGPYLIVTGKQTFLKYSQWG